MSLKWDELKNRWEAEVSGVADANIVVSTYAELPNPSTVDAGAVSVVHNDADPGLNGLHVCHGLYWRQA